MSKFYGAEHRKLQDEFDTRRLADLMEGGVMHAEFAPHEVEFIQSRDMFFLSTLDPAGRPTVSYKGGAPGFVRVVGQSSLIFPWFDGNGMFYSAGNLWRKRAKSACFSSISSRLIGFVCKARQDSCAKRRSSLPTLARYLSSASTSRACG
ncbi:pyridoxamine 5'-phosphate oxidase family protein [Methylocystis silviterrae]|uniref:pyridoxamine 5'-phosphate oxidase family protein n=1 Tax=Methylocystis silviterrae TaxID=2743612 RepID=UPI001E5D56A2|nr:pyridoxamine 5'-phosphate oxidase family protein [Methylocystis silviterrae]